MRHIFMTLLLTWSGYAYTCDTCGGGSANFFLGDAAVSNDNFIGVRQQHLRFSTLHYNLVRDRIEKATSVEVALHSELLANIKIHDKWSIITLVPYNSFRQEKAETNNFHGLGDVVTIVNYRLFDFAPEESLIAHRLIVGAGVKWATGSYLIEENQLFLNPNFQLGTGSTDALMNLRYRFTNNNFGLVSEMNYRYTTANSEAYRFGNRFLGAVHGFYRFMTGINHVMTPKLGMFYQYAARDFDDNRPVFLSQGYFVHASLGLQFTYRNLILGVNWQEPVLQDFASRQIRSERNLIFNLFYTF